MPKTTMRYILTLTWAVASALSCISFDDAALKDIIRNSPAWYAIPYFLFDFGLKLNCLAGFLGCGLMLVEGCKYLGYLITGADGQSFSDFLSPPCTHYNVSIRDREVICRGCGKVLGNFTEKEQHDR